MKKTKKIHCHRSALKGTAKGKFFREKKYEIRMKLKH